jgi:ABC-type dipeptide/oligopeptide/nickel transport system permease component
MGIVMIGAVAVIVANLIADLAYAALDPRVALGGRRP